MRIPWNACFLAALVAVWPACRATDINRRRSGFPTPDSMEALSRQPSPAVDASGWRDVRAFELTGPFPPDWRDAPPTGPLAVRLASGLPQRHRMTAAGECVAREVAQFHLAQGALPSPGLQTYIMGRCRALWANTSFSWLRSEAETTPPPLAEETALAEPRLAELLASLSERDADVDYGVAVVRQGRATIFVIAYGPRRARVEAVQRLDEGGRFEVRGTLLIAAGRVSAVANQGAYGFADCEVDKKVALPDFRVDCSTRKEDGEAWLEVGAFPPDRFLGQTAASLLVSPSDRATLRYEAPLSIGTMTATTVADLRSQMFDAVAGLRQRAGLEPLALADRQSEVADRLAPHYFANAGTDGDRETLEKISLGLRAGWELSPVVRYGLFTTGLIAGTDDTGALVGTVMTRPFGRQVLLDPAVRHLAIGALVEPTLRLQGVLITTYATFGEDEGDGLAAAVERSLAEARKADGRTPPRLWGQQPEARAAAAKRIRAGETSPSEALEELVTLYGNAARGWVQGYVLEAGAVEDLPWPEPLLKAVGLEVDLVATFHRSKDQAWGRYVVLVLVNGRIQSAGLPASTAGPYSGIIAP